MRSLVPNYKARASFGDLFGDFESLFNTAPLTSNFILQCDISESENQICLTFDVPGLKKEDLNIELENSVLTVSGERKLEGTSSDDEKKTYRERKLGVFSRSFRLPDTIDTENVEAQNKDGVLTVHLPKVEKTKPKKIAISAS